MILIGYNTATCMSGIIIFCKPYRNTNLRSGSDVRQATRTGTHTYRNPEDSKRDSAQEIQYTPRPTQAPHAFVGEHFSRAVCPYDNHGRRG